MKKDAPPSTTRLAELAEGLGYVIHKRVGSGLTPVISIDGDVDVIRFFQPEIQTRPWGTDLSGCIGLGLRSGDAYAAAICHHVLNYRDFLRADRTIDDLSNVPALLQILRRHLDDLPRTRAEILVWAGNDETWLGKFIRWGRPHALAFMEQVQIGRHD